MNKHIISVLVQNQPGVLAHIANMFAARGFNIDSLVVGRTEDPTFSRMVIASTGDDLTMEQIRTAGLRALSTELGAVGMVRFLQQFETGYGDYTLERQEWLDQDTVQDVAQRIREGRGIDRMSSDDEG